MQINICCIIAPIEPCVITEAKRKLLWNKYTIQRNNTWLLTCLGTSQTFVISCNESGNWESVPCRVENGKYKICIEVVLKL